MTAIRDEPARGLAPLIVKEVFRSVVQMPDEGCRFAGRAECARRAGQAFVQESGHIRYSGPVAELGSDEERIQALAGASAEEWHLDEVRRT